jgi:hypothetical protein
MVYSYYKNGFVAFLFITLPFLALKTTADDTSDSSENIDKKCK